MKKKINTIQYGFDDVFRFAETYGVHWNPANDLFFHTIFEYKSIDDFHVEELKDELEIKSSKDFTKEQFDAASDSVKAKIILLAFAETEGLEGSFQINSR